MGRISYTRIRTSDLDNLHNRIRTAEQNHRIAEQNRMGVEDILRSEQQMRKKNCREFEDSMKRLKDEARKFEEGTLGLKL